MFLHLFSDSTHMKRNFLNNIYSTYIAKTHPDISTVNVNIISPCTEAHRKKYSHSSQVMFSEDKHTYEKTVKPYIQSIPPSHTQWVRNVLDKTAESERILYESSPFDD
eukprot:Sdes_comp18214_c0_seq1m7789